MGRRKRRTESSGKGADPTPEGAAANQMRRFRSLTKRLLTVSRDELREEEKKYKRDRSIKSDPEKS
jgi:hypothetical protein